MNYSLQLIAIEEDERYTTEIPLYDCIITNEYRDVQVYDDLRYEFVVVFDAVNSGRYSDFKLEINGESVDGYPEPISDEGEPLKIKFMPRNKRPFNTYYDFVRIGIDFILDRKEYTLISEEILCLNRTSLGQNIKNMFSYIMSIEDDDINEAVFRRDDSSYFAIEEETSTYGRDGKVTLESLLTYVNDSITFFENHVVEFKSKPKQTVRQNPAIIKASNANRISYQDIDWLAKNSENLSPVKHKTGIRFGNKFYMPLRVKSLDREISLDTYENQEILNYLYSLSRRVKQVVDGLVKIIESENESVEQLAGYEDEKYKVASLELKRWNINKSSSLLDEYEKQSARLKRLVRRYSELFDLKGKVSNSAIKRTKTFAQVNHYKYAYNVMKKWENINVSYNKYVAVSGIRTVSEIYEYYCLIKLLEMLKKHGFSLLKLDVAESVYQYDDSVVGTNIKKSIVANTYALSNDVFTVKLYYEPMIYSYYTEKNNNIGLFRTNANKNYYCPDFILSFRHNETAYAKHVIIDAKFKSVNDALCDLKEGPRSIISKYYVDLCCGEENDRISMVWILNGKGEHREDEHTLNYYQSTPLRDKLLVTPSFGVCGLISSDNKLDEFYEEISRQIGC